MNVNSRHAILPRLLPLLLAVATLSATAYAAPRTSDHWVGTWAAAPMAAPNVRRFRRDVPPPNGTLHGTAPTAAAATAPRGTEAAATVAPAIDPNQVYAATDTTLREIVHVSMGGPMVRVVFTNEFGTGPLTIAAAEAAISRGGGSIDPAASVALTFGGRASITIPPGALAVSDPARLHLAAESDLAISLFLPAQPIARLSEHGYADQTSYAAHGNQVAAKTLDAPREIRSWLFVKGVDVEVPAPGAAIVAFGDSITDGAYSAMNGNARWPDELARRLQANKSTADIGVLNEGIGGNRLLHDGTGPSALARFDRDVIDQAGVKYVIILEAINDIGHAYDPVRPYDRVSADDLIGAYIQMTERAHMHGIKVYFATLTPYVGAKYASPAGEKVREALNKWIRTTPLIDGFIDFDKTVRDPSNPTMFLPAYDHGMHLHPSDAGYKAMGDSIDLKLFQSR